MFSRSWKVGTMTDSSTAPEIARLSDGHAGCIFDKGISLLSCIRWRECSWCLLSRLDCRSRTFRCHYRRSQAVVDDATGRMLALQTPLTSFSGPGIIYSAFLGAFMGAFLSAGGPWLHAIWTAQQHWFNVPAVTTAVVGRDPQIFYQLLIVSQQQPEENVAWRV
jgi:hypothetical protein